MKTIGVHKSMMHQIKNSFIIKKRKRHQTCFCLIATGDELAASYADIIQHSFYYGANFDMDQEKRQLWHKPIKLDWIQKKQNC